jgi:putative transposase
MSVREKRSLISPDNPRSIQRQCELLELQRSSYYYDPVESEVDTRVMNDIHDIWTLYPFYGYRRITVELKDRGLRINHKRVLKLMKLMGLKSILPKPRLNTSIPNKQDPVRPYLLKDIKIVRPNQVWATDITYIKLPGGMVYLFALIDWHTRFVVGWKLAITLESCHIIEVLHKAVHQYGAPEIVNSDQGSQFTCELWITTLEAYGTKVSHDGVGRCIDNIRIERLWWSIKYEHVYLHSHQTVWELEKGLTEYLEYYNNKRPHQALGYKRPADLYVAEQEMVRTRFARHISRGAAPNPGIFVKCLKEFSCMSV